MDFSKKLTLGSGHRSRGRAIGACRLDDRVVRGGVADGSHSIRYRPDPEMDHLYPFCVALSHAV
jgi:hypothetical protein